MGFKLDEKHKPVALESFDDVWGNDRDDKEEKTEIKEPKKENAIKMVENSISTSNDYKFEMLDYTLLTPFTEYGDYDQYNYEEDSEKFKDLMEKIKMAGIIEPLILWEKENEETGKTEYLVLSGNHRLKAIKTLKEQGLISYTKIPTLRKKALTKVDAEFIFNATNLCRRELADMNVYSKAKALYQLAESTKQKIKELNKERPKDDQLSYNVDADVGEQYKLGTTQVNVYKKLYKTYSKKQFDLIGDKHSIDIKTAYQISFIPKKSKEIFNKILDLIESNTLKINESKAMAINDYLDIEKDPEIEEIIKICNTEKEATTYSLKVKDFIEYDRKLKGKSKAEITNCVNIFIKQVLKERKIPFIIK